MNPLQKLFRRFTSTPGEPTLSESASTSNSCFTLPALSLGQDFKPWLKERLKSQRPFFRSLYGMRAVREAVRSMALGKKGAKDHFLASLSFMAGGERVMGRPMNITLEPINTCNLRCPICETGAGKLGRSPQNMSMEAFQTIIDKIGAHTNTLMFYFMGEPFLNKHAYDMIRYGKEKAGIPFITTCTNGDFVDPVRIVESGLDEVSFQIGGMTQTTHETYRVNSNLERVMKNLRETIRVRNEKKGNLKIHCGFILMKHNEHEVETFKKRMAEYGVDQAVVVDPCVRTHEEGLRYLPENKAHWFYDPEAFKKGILKPRSLPPNECPWIYYSISIHVNGSVVPCCRDPLGKHVMGNLLTDTLDEVWNGEKFRNFRKRLHQDQGQIDICRLCSSYAPSTIK